MLPVCNMNLDACSTLLPTSSSGVEFPMKWMAVGCSFLAQMASSVVTRYLQTLSEM